MPFAKVTGICLAENPNQNVFFSFTYCPIISSPYCPLLRQFYGKIPFGNNPTLMESWHVSGVVKITRLSTVITSCKFHTTSEKVIRLISAVCQNNQNRSSGGNLVLYALLPEELKFSTKFLYYMWE